MAVIQNLKRFKLINNSSSNIQHIFRSKNMENTSEIWVANNFTCVIASHISTITRFEWLEECIQNCQQYFNKIILSVSYEEDMHKYIVSLSETISDSSNIMILVHKERKLQFDHIKSVSLTKDALQTEMLIFIDDDDLFLPSVVKMVPILYDRYKQHTGVQIMYDELDDNGSPMVDVDFSGTFCKTEFLHKWLRDNPKATLMYDADCVFVQDISDGGRGIPNYFTDFGIDDDIIPYVSRKTHNLERDWGK